MASLQERVNNRKFYKRVRRDGKWVTIDTRTGKVVDKATRLKHKTENKKKWIQRGKNREEAVKNWASKNIGDRLVFSDDYSKDKGRLLTKRESNKEYEKEVANRDTGKDDAEMNAQQQARALKLSKKRDLTNIKVDKPKSEQLKVNKKDDNKDEKKKENKVEKSNKSRLKMHSIERKNREIHGDAAVERLKTKHKEWKKARKEGKLDEWRKKWGKK